MDKNKSCLENIPTSLITKWQGMADLLAKLMNIQAALIMKTENNYMEVFISSASKGNPYNVGEKEKWDGLYCQTVIRNQDKLEVPNAVADPDWANNPDIKFGMIAYLGYPVNYPDGRPFGTICVLTNEEKHFTEEEDSLLKQFKYMLEADLIITESQYKNHEKYRIMFETLPIGVVYQNADGIITSANPAAERILGISFEQMKGLTSMDPQWRTIREDGSDLPGHLHPIPVALRTGEEVKDFVHGIYHPGKQSFVWIKITATPIFYEGATKPYQAYAVFEDITDGKLTEKYLRESEEKYRTLITTMNDALIHVDNYDRILFVNKRFCKMFGFAFDELIGKIGYENIIYELDRDIIKSKAELRIDNISDKYEVRGKKKSGEIFWISISGSPIRDSNQKTVGSVGVIRDITARKRAEEEVILTRDTYLSIINSVSEAIYVQDEAGSFIYINKGAEDIYGYTRDELIGKNPYSVAAPGMNKLEELMAFGAEVFKTGVPKRFDFWAVRKNGEIFPKEVIVSKGSYFGKPCLITTARDITERLQTEVALHNVQKLESLGILAGGIAHDFNNLMAGVFGFIDLAIMQSDDKIVINSLSKAMSTIERARGLTQQLLTFAKGGAPVQKIGKLFPFVKETAKFALSGSNVSCSFSIPQNLWVCNFDKNQVGQVIDNLIINAQQAMPIGGIISLVAENIVFAEKEHSVLTKGNYVKLTIKDSGIGISNELISKIFDPFFTTKQKGHGLGLSTCYSIIKRHGGSIDVASEPDKGSTFTIYLPACVDSEPSSAIAATIEHKGSGLILVMDDEKVIRETISAILISLGYNVVCKENGKEAVEYFNAASEAQQTFAGMFFDLTVPGGMGGEKAVAEIRKTNSDVPVFVISGYADDPVMINPEIYGFTASICKPFRRSDLAEILNKYIGI